MYLFVFYQLCMLFKRYSSSGKHEIERNPVEDNKEKSKTHKSRENDNAMTNNEIRENNNSSQNALQKYKQYEQH